MNGTKQKSWNLIESASADPDRERFEELFRGGSFRVERITSMGQATPQGAWYDQEQAEWVIVLSGSASLRFENGMSDVRLNAGDAVTIAPHERHRVSWTDPDVPTVWLAIHYDPEPTDHIE